MIREVLAEACQILEAPGHIPALSEPFYRSFDADFLIRSSELKA